jgi:hypothetical protein
VGGEFIEFEDVVSILAEEDVGLGSLCQVGKSLLENVSGDFSLGFPRFGIGKAPRWQDVVDAKAVIFLKKCTIERAENDAKDGHPHL